MLCTTGLSSHPTPCRPVRRWGERALAQGPWPPSLAPSPPPHPRSFLLGDDPASGTTGFASQRHPGRKLEPLHCAALGPSAGQECSKPLTNIHVSEYFLCFSKYFADHCDCPCPQSGKAGQGEVGNSARCSYGFNRLESAQCGLGLQPLDVQRRPWRPVGKSDLSLLFIIRALWTPSVQGCG